MCPAALPWGLQSRYRHTASAHAQPANLSWCASALYASSTDTVALRQNKSYTTCLFAAAKKLRTAAFRGLFLCIPTCVTLTDSQGEGNVSTFLSASRNESTPRRTLNSFFRRSGSLLLLRFHGVPNRQQEMRYVRTLPTEPRSAVGQIGFYPASEQVGRMREARSVESGTRRTLLFLVS